MLQFQMWKKYYVWASVTVQCAWAVLGFPDTVRRSRYAATNILRIKKKLWRMIKINGCSVRYIGLVLKPTIWWWCSLVKYWKRLRIREGGREAEAESKLWRGIILLWKLCGVISRWRCISLRSTSGQAKSIKWESCLCENGRCSVVSQSVTISVVSTFFRQLMLTHSYHSHTHTHTHIFRTGTHFISGNKWSSSLILFAIYLLILSVHRLHTHTHTNIMPAKRCRFGIARWMYLH